MIRIKTSLDEKTRSPGSAPALDRGLDILERLGMSSSGLTLSELSDQLELPKNSVFRITQTLLARGYLSRDPETLSFQLTGRLLRLAPPRWGAVSLPAVSRDSMTALRDEVRETVQIGVLNGLEGVIIEQVEGLEPLRIVVDLGLRFALHNNAPGKLFLAHMKSEQRRGIISQLELTASTPRTITTKTELRRECDRILTNGYATDHAEADEGIHRIAAPIFGANETIVGAIWISGPAKRLPQSRFQELGVRVIATGHRISRLIGEMP